MRRRRLHSCRVSLLSPTLKRPHDICPGEDPALFKDEDGNTCDGVGKGASKFDIVQGQVQTLPRIFPSFKNKAKNAQPM